MAASTILFVLLLLNVSAASPGPAELLKTCWNEKYISEPSSFLGWLHAETTRFYLADVWWPKNNDSELPLTIFTMSSLDRLYMVEAQCREYAGPLAVAVYLPLLAFDGAADANVTNSTPPTTQTRRQQRQQGDPGDEAAQQEKEGRKAARRFLEAAVSGGGAAGEAAAGVTEETKIVEARHAAELAHARAVVQALFDRMESERSSYRRSSGAQQISTHGSAAASHPPCSLRMVLFVERSADRQLVTAFPQNAMRNAIMLAVQTPLVLMLDADLGLSPSINTLITNLSWVDFVSNPAGTGRPALAILPAFEANPRLDLDTARKIVDAALTGSKADVAKLWHNNSMQAFQAHLCWSCHAPIRHMLWAAVDQPYTVKFAQDFEPWGIMNRFNDPGYDERFRGWHHDKISYTDSIARIRNFSLVVVPGAWLVHRPHMRVALALLATNEVKKEHSTNGSAVAKEQVTCNENIKAMLEVIRLSDGKDLTAFKRYDNYMWAAMRMQRMVPNGGPHEPQVNSQVKHCKAVLPWWQR